MWLSRYKCREWDYLFVAAQLGSECRHLLCGRSSVHLNLDQLLHEAVALHTELLALEPDVRFNDEALESQAPEKWHTVVAANEHFVADVFAQEVSVASQLRVVGRARLDDERVVHRPVAPTRVALRDRKRLRQFEHSQEVKNTVHVQYCTACKLHTCTCVHVHAIGKHNKVKITTKQFNIQTCNTGGIKQGTHL